MTAIRTTATNFGISPRWLMGALAASLCVAAGCDAPERESLELERQPEGEVSLRPGTNSGGWGSIRLNTPQYHKYKMGEVPRDASPITSPDEPELTYSLVRVELDNEEPFHIEGGNPLELSEGKIVLDGFELTQELLLGARLVYEMSLPGEPDPIEIGATITGVMFADGPTGQVPLVNLEWDPGIWNEHKKYPHHTDPDYPDQEPGVCPSPYPTEDPNLWGVEGDAISDNGVRPNNFDLGTSAVLYNDIYLDSSSAEVLHEDMFMTIACVSGAAGKAALWGFPGWVHQDTDRGLDRYQQLQNAMAMIRFDVCRSGDPNTEDGTPVQIRDRYVGSFDVAGDTEAVWGLDGRAICIGTPRLESGTPLPMSCGGADIPTCNSTHEAMLDSDTAFAWTKRPTLSLPPPPIPAPPGACETTSPTPGCAEEPAIEACVCDADPYCCHTAWDSICVNEVTSLACDDNVPYPDACASQPYPSPGTSNEWVEECVCDADSYCCTTSWDSICADEVVSLGCGVCS